MEKNIFSKRLKDLREEKKISKTELATIIGCDQPKISKMENPNEKTLPTVDNLINMSRYFHVSTDYLLGVEKYDKSSLNTFADIIQRLFDIEVSTNISIIAHDEERYEESLHSYYPDLVNITMFEFAFEEHGAKGYYLNKFMKEWKEIREFLKDKDDKISAQMYELWKRDQLEKASKLLLSGTVIPFTDIDDELPFD